MRTRLTALCLCLTAGLTGQMEKRWSGQFELTKFERQKPAVFTPAPKLPLFDLDGRPRSLELDAGRRLVLLAGSFT